MCVLILLVKQPGLKEDQAGWKQVCDRLSAGNNNQGVLSGNVFRRKWLCGRNCTADNAGMHSISLAALFIREETGGRKRKYGSMFVSFLISCASQSNSNLELK
jgi:hypothetical protein